MLTLHHSARAKPWHRIHSGVPLWQRIVIIRFRQKHHALMCLRSFQATRPTVPYYKKYGIKPFNRLALFDG